MREKYSLLSAACPHVKGRTQLRCEGEGSGSGKELEI